MLRLLMVSTPLIGSFPDLRELETQLSLNSGALCLTQPLLRAMEELIGSGGWSMAPLLPPSRLNSLGRYSGLHRFPKVGRRQFGIRETFLSMLSPFGLLISTDSQLEKGQQVGGKTTQLYVVCAELAQNRETISSCTAPSARVSGELFFTGLGDNAFSVIGLKWLLGYH